MFSALCNESSFPLSWSFRWLHPSQLVFSALCNEIFSLARIIEVRLVFGQQTRWKLILLPFQPIFISLLSSLNEMWLIINIDGYSSWVNLRTSVVRSCSWSAACRAATFKPEAVMAATRKPCSPGVMTQAIDFETWRSADSWYTRRANAFGLSARMCPASSCPGRSASLSIDEGALGEQQ